MLLLKSINSLIIISFTLLTVVNVNANIEPISRFWSNRGIDPKTSESIEELLRQNLKSIISTENNVDIRNILLRNDFNNIRENEELNPECVDFVEEWLRQLISPQPRLWAVQMIDAWGKFPEGILSGHLAVPGDFDECLRIRGNVSTPDQLTNFKGRYCYTNVLLLGVVPLQFGTCYPSVCSASDITILQNAGLSFLNTTASQFGCYTDDPPEFTAGDIAMITFLTILVAICILGTIVDLVYNRKEASATEQKGMAIQCLVAFSLYRNTMKWLSTKSGGDNLGCIHGLRFFSTSWVVLGHSWLMMVMQPMWNLADVVYMQKDRWTLFAVMNGTLSVDTFFTMSGLLFSYNLLKMLEKSKGRLNILMLYLHRYLRLTPTYAILVGIMATWFKYLGNGPMWAGMDKEADFCARNWWHNLLYINNLWYYDYDNGDGMCHGESWYLSVDFQFFIISPLFIYPLWRWKKIGLTFMALVTAASVAVPFAVTYDLHLEPTLLPLAQGLTFKMKSYLAPWMRIGPYMTGLFAGYLLHQCASTKKRLKLPKLVVIAGWTITTGSALAIIFAAKPFFEPEAVISKLDSAFYAGFHRIGWGVIISWIIVTCTQGNGGFVNTFLCWKVFMPLGRLTFCVYLISFQLQSLFHARVRQAVSYDVYTTTNLFLAHLVMSFLVGFICCMTIESPFIILEKLIFQGGNNGKKVPEVKPTESDAKANSEKRENVA